MRQTSKIALAWELHLEDTPKIHIASHLQVNRKTVRRWIKGISEVDNLEMYLDSYICAKKGSRAKRKIDPLLKRRIWEIRETNKDCCGQKIQYFLRKDYNTKVSATTIYKVLNEKYQLRSKWKKNQKRGPVPKASKPREVIQMDTVDFGELFAFTAVDIYSKESDVIIRPSLTSHDGLVFLETSMDRRFNGYSDLIQADGGPEFKDKFKANVYKYTKRYRVAKPYKKNEQSFIESFNRSLRKECLGWTKYKRNQIQQATTEVNNWLIYYHYTRPHIGLGMKTPLVGHI